MKGRKTTTPAKILRRAARMRTRLRIGDLTLVVEETTPRDEEARVHGCMRGTGRILGELLSARDRSSRDDDLLRGAKRKGVRAVDTRA